MLHTVRTQTEHFRHLLALAEHGRLAGPVPHRRWLVWSPMLFAAVLVHNPLDLAGGFKSGIGLAALAVAAICMLGGYAIAGNGPRLVRACTDWSRCRRSRSGR